MRPADEPPSGKAAADSRAAFPPTCWTDVISLRGGGGETQASGALCRLCESYWSPLYAFARHRGLSRHDSEDAVQGFFLSTADAAYFAKAERGRGKLRTFLLTGFTRHLKDIRAHDNALKRGGGKPMVSLDANQAEEWLQIDGKTGTGTPALAFEREWARSTIRAAIGLLRGQCSASAAAQERFAVLSRFLNPETCEGTTQAQAAAELGITEDACAKAVQRLRADFRLAVREQVAATLEHPDEQSVTEEMQQLQRSLMS